MSDLARPEDDYVCLDATLKEQVGFCLLGGFGITAEMNHAIYDRLQTEDIFAPGQVCGGGNINPAARACPGGRKAQNESFPELSELRDLLRRCTLWKGRHPAPTIR